MQLPGCHAVVVLDLLRIVMSDLDFHNRRKQVTLASCLDWFGFEETTPEHHHQSKTTRGKLR